MIAELRRWGRNCVRTPSASSPNTSTGSSHAQGSTSIRSSSRVARPTSAIAGCPARIAGISNFVPIWRPIRSGKTAR